MTLRSWPEPKPRVRCLTDWATQMPPKCFCNTLTSNRSFQHFSSSWLTDQTFIHCPQPEKLIHPLALVWLPRFWGFVLGNTPDLSPAPSPQLCGGHSTYLRPLWGPAPTLAHQRHHWSFPSLAPKLASTRPITIWPEHSFSESKIFLFAFIRFK